MKSGYSKTPLVKKLGIKENFIIKLINQPVYYFSIVDLPESVSILDKKNSTLCDFIHYFIIESEIFFETLPKLKQQIKQNGMIWISWDKTKSKDKQAINENLIRQRALSIGLVDIKVCSVNEIWSGLKLVIRKENRN